MNALHGTSLASHQRIVGGGNPVPVFSESNVSIGGAYFTTSAPHARFHAETAAREHASEAVVLTIALDESKLLPDEDWVVLAFEESPLNAADEILDPRLRAFFDALFAGYVADSSLSDHYKARYAELNASHGITWRDSAQWIQRFRQADSIAAHQVIRVDLVSLD